MQSTKRRKTESVEWLASGRRPTDYTRCIERKSLLGIVRRDWLHGLASTASRGTSIRGRKINSETLTFPTVLRNYSTDREWLRDCNLTSLFSGLALPFTILILFLVSIVLILYRWNSIFSIFVILFLHIAEIPFLGHMHTYTHTCTPFHC